MKKGWLFTYYDTSGVGQKPAEVARKKKWSMLSFIDSESEIATWMVYSFKTKSTKSRAKQRF